MYRLQQQNKVLGSQAFYTLVAADNKKAEQALTALWSRTAEFEKRFSRFLPDSELTYLNHHAGSKAKVSRLMQDLLAAAKRAAEGTGGLYNPFILPALQQAGYVGSWPQPEKFSKDIDYRKNAKTVPASELKISKDYATIPAGSAIDFGGIGKGYLLDELAAWLSSQGCVNFWLSLGGDIICAGQDVNGQPWAVDVQHATNDKTSVATITNDSKTRMAIATSGTTKRRGANAGKPWHHIIDPRSGQPATTDILTATVVDSDATMADVYAKCLVILGSERAKDFAKTHGITQAILQFKKSGEVIIKNYGKEQA